MRMNTLEWQDDNLVIKSCDGDTIDIELKQVPESKISIVWDGQEGWNIYRRDLFLINVPYELDVTEKDNYIHE